MFTLNTDGATVPCPNCGDETLPAYTNRMSKGAPVLVYLDPKPDNGGHYMLSQVSGEFYAGVCGRGQLAGMRAASQPIYSDHKITCRKRGSTKPGSAR